MTVIAILRKLVTPIGIVLYSAYCAAAPIKANCDPFTSAGRDINITQRLRANDTMSITFSSGNNFNELIRNADGTPVRCSGTTTTAFTGVTLVMPSIMNGKKVTDLHQSHSGSPVGTLELAAFVDVGGNVEKAGIGDWLIEKGYVGGNELTVPDFSSNASTLFYGVDLSIWTLRGFVIDDLLLGQTFNILNGVSTLLPGILFSPDALTLGASGWESTNLFSGVVTLDSFHIMFAVPEPATALLVAIALVGVASSRRPPDSARRANKKRVLAALGVPS